MFSVGFRKHWIKVTIMSILIAGLLYIGVVPIIFTSALIHEKIVDGTDSRNSDYLGKIINVAPFVSVGRTEFSVGWRKDYFYLTTGAKAHNSRKSASLREEEGFVFNNYAKLKVFEVKKFSVGYFGVEELCLLKSDDYPRYIVSEECVNLDKINKITKVFFEAESEIRKFGSAYISIDKEYASVSLKPVSQAELVNTYKVTSKQELISLLTPGNLSFDDYFWIDYIHPVLVRHEKKIWGQK